MVIAPGWYILGVHDVSWEASPYLSGLALTMPPDVFTQCVEQANAQAKLVSVDEGYTRWSTGQLDRAYVSFWFDDAYAGVRRYAAPVLERFGVSAAISVNSRFLSRTEMLWRAKLSYLSYRDGMRFVRSRLRRFGYKSGDLVRHASMDLFAPEIVAEIDAIYQRFTNEADRQDAFRVFDTWDGIRQLRDKNWTICNHGAAHLPILEKNGLPLMAAEFGECEDAIRRELSMDTKFWVAPFDRGSKRDPSFQTVFDACAGPRTLVLVGQRFNREWRAGQPIYRIAAPNDPSTMRQLLAQTAVA
ncbi:MAG: polysaccharide deacetylase family protein [Gemmatimonadaceae bacterium]